MRMEDMKSCTSLASRRRVMRLTPLIVVGVLFAGGCVPDFVEEGNSTRVLLLTGIDDGAVLESDVSPACPDIAQVRVENHAKNPNAPVAGFRDDIVIERYEVRYFRSDGRGTEGADVPFRISGNLAFEIQAGAAVNVPIEEVRRQAKLEAPLNTLIQNGGGLIVTMFAEITLWARGTTGEATNSVSGRLQIDFADFAGTATTRASWKRPPGDM